MATTLRNGKEVVNVSNEDGFPLESWPPQGTITIHFKDGSTERLCGSPVELAELQFKYGLCDQKHLDSVRKEYLS
ncbi:hypothetical protein QOT17_016016 [Balamuthia mandrillaris]